MAPSAKVPGRLAAAGQVVIAGVHVEVRDLGDALAGRLLRDGADV